MQRKEGPQKWRYVLDGLLTKDFPPASAICLFRVRAYVKA